MNTNLELKSLLLSHGRIRVTQDLLAFCETHNLSLARAIRRDNIYSHPWLFFRISDNCHVRMVAVPDSSSLELSISKQETDRYDIYNYEMDIFIAHGLKLETVVRHCPGQLFYSLYKSCSMGCRFCPYPFASPQPRIDINTILKEVELLGDACTGVGFTSGIPENISEDDVALEMALLCRVLKSRINPSIRIGASPKQPTQLVLSQLKEAGIDELRINLEVYNFVLAQKLMPKKDIKKLSNRYLMLYKFLGEVRSVPILFWVLVKQMMM